jgi:CheY-like chemotaxis protein
MPFRTILYIEDDHDTRVALRQVLEAEGYRVLTAADGRAGLVMAQSTPPPALVLLDLKMPMMDGREVLSILKKDSKLARIPVVVLSAHGTATDAKDANEFIRKPMSLDVLVDVARRYCRLNGV